MTKEISRSALLECLGLAAIFAIVSGLVEGALGYGLKQQGWHQWGAATNAGRPEMLWLAPLVNLAVMLPLGAAYWLASGFVRQFTNLGWAAGLFCFLTLFDWLGLSGMLATSAAVVLSAGLGVQYARWRMARPIGSRRLWRNLKIAMAAWAAVFASLEGGNWAIQSAKLRQIPPADAQVPNIVLIVMDTVRADHLSSYGYPRKTTPTLDALAAKGVLFERAYAASPWSLPSHATLLTGLFPYQHGATRKARPPVLGMRHRTLAEEIREMGYVTAGFPANIHWGGAPAGMDRGFHYFMRARTSVLALKTFYGYKAARLLNRVTGWRPPPEDPTADDVNGEFVAWLAQRPNHPYFAYLNYMEVHEPYTPPAPYATAFGPISPAIATIESPEAVHPKDVDLPSLVNAYDAELAYLDSKIKELLDKLAESGSLENTIFLITSDHGEALGENGILEHGRSLYKSVLHIPLIVASPAGPDAPRRVAAPVSQQQVAATILELAAGTQRTHFEHLPGPSLACHLLGTQPCPAGENSVLAEEDASDFPNAADWWPSKQGWLKSIIKGKWQLILREDGHIEMFDLESDPGGLHNVADAAEARAALPDLLAELRSKTGVR